MLKNTLAFSTALIMLAITVPAFAQTSTSTMASSVAAKIACVGTAVNAREQSIDAAITAFTGATNAAYAARATALQQAYTNTTLKTANQAVKVAWSAFNASVRSARKAWQTARSTAWSVYGKAATACKAPVGTGDGSNSTSEVSGN